MSENVRDQIILHEADYVADVEVAGVVAEIAAAKHQLDDEVIDESQRKIGLDALQSDAVQHSPAEAEFVLRRFTEIVENYWERHG